jgi:hypothetical protein
VLHGAAEVGDRAGHTASFEGDGGATDPGCLARQIEGEDAIESLQARFGLAGRRGQLPRDRQQ